MQNKYHIQYNRTAHFFFTLYLKILTFNHPEKEAFEDIEEKGENAGTQHFLFFPHCFLLCLIQISIFESHLLCRLQLP